MKATINKQQSTFVEIAKLVAVAMLAMAALYLLLLLSGAHSCHSVWKYTHFKHKYEWDGGVCLVERDGEWVPGYVVQYELATGKPSPLHNHAGERK